MVVLTQKSEAIIRGARMLRTALGPAIAGFLEDPSIVEVMLNPDGRLWIDRLSGGLSDTGERLNRRRWRADRAPGRAPCRRRGSCRKPPRLGRIARDRRAVRGIAAASGRRSDLRDPQARGRRVHARRLRRCRHHDIRPGRGASHSGRRAQKHPRRRRHLDRQDHAHQRAAGRGRQNSRSRGADRGYPRAAMPGAEPGGAAHQGRRGLAVRSRALLVAPAPRPHSDRRSARR